MAIEAARPKRYNWLRFYNTFPGHKKWRLVARDIGVNIAVVEAIATRLFVCANRGKPRGSLDEWSTAECAADLDMPVETVAAIYKRLEEIGYIDRAYLSTWDERQPDKLDTTNAQRQARYRERLNRTVENGRAALVTPLLTPKTQTKTRKKERKNPPEQKTMLLPLNNPAGGRATALSMGAPARPLAAEQDQEERKFPHQVGRAELETIFAGRKAEVG